MKGGYGILNEFYKLSRGFYLDKAGQSWLCCFLLLAVVLASFYCLQLYQAYVDYHDRMNLFKELVERCVFAIYGGASLIYQVCFIIRSNV
jgi:hypothetical protein